MQKQGKGSRWKVQHGERKYIIFNDDENVGMIIQKKGVHREGDVRKLGEKENN